MNYTKHYLAFLTGFDNGMRDGKEYSAKEAMLKHPQLTVDEIDAFTEGSIDGFRKDFYRADLAVKKIRL